MFSDKHECGIGGRWLRCQADCAQLRANTLSSVQSVSHLSHCPPIPHLTVGFKMAHTYLGFIPPYLISIHSPPNTVRQHMRQCSLTLVILHHSRDRTIAPPHKYCLVNQRKRQTQTTRTYVKYSDRGTCCCLVPSKQTLSNAINVCLRLYKKSSIEQQRKSVP